MAKSNRAAPGFIESIKSRFATTSETLASLVTISIIVVLSIMGIFGAPNIIKENIVGVLCTLLAVTTIFIYNIWHSQLQVEKHAKSTRRTLSELVQAKSPFSVPSEYVGPELNIMVDSAENWLFRGGSGRWQRSTVLPALSKITKRDVPYQMLILDPRSDELCAEYARYRNKHRTDGTVSTTDSVRNDVLACIVAAAWYSRQSRIMPTVHLAQTYSPLRQDFSDSKVAITVADPAEEGLFVPKSSWYYQSLVDEFQQFQRRSPRVEFKDVTHKMPSWQELSATHVRAILLSITTVSSDGEVSPLASSEELETVDLHEVSRIVFKGRKS